MLSSFVEIKGKDDQLQRQVQGMRGQLSAMGVAIGAAAGNLVSGAIERAAGALFGFLSKGISGAVELQDVLSATSAIFGDSASIITARADELAAKFGTVKSEYIQAAQGFGAAFKAAGVSTSEAAGIGNQVAKLGMDLASFKGGSTTNADAFTALSAALRGEFDPLERFNVMLTAAAVGEEAVSLGLVKNARDMDEAAKKQATLSLIMKKSIDQQGDLERTGDQVHNSWGKLTGTITNLSQDIGTRLMPAIDAVVSVGAEMATDLAAAFGRNEQSFADFASGVAEWARTIGVAWRNLPIVWEMVQIRAREMASNVVAALATLPENGAIVGSWFARNFVNLFRDAGNALVTIFKNLGENIGKLGEATRNWMAGKGFHADFKPLLGDFKAVTEAMPELVKPGWVSLQAEMDAAGQRMADRESKRAESIASRARGAATAGRVATAVAAAAGKAKDFKSETLDSADFYFKLRESALGGGDDTPKQQLASQKKTEENTRKIAALLGGGALTARLA